MAKGAATPPVRDKMQLDDFLNIIETEGRRELAAAFALRAKAHSWIKRTLEEWREDLEAFAREVPK